MDKEEQKMLLKMADDQFQKIKVSKSFEDKTRAFRLMDNLLETYLSSLETSFTN